MTNTNSGTGVATPCQFQFSDGRSCRMLRSPVHSSFCAFHARQELQLLGTPDAWEMDSFGSVQF